MMKDVNVKLDPELPWQKQHSTPIGLKFTEEDSEVLHLEHSTLWC